MASLPSYVPPSQNREADGKFGGDNGVWCQSGTWKGEKRLCIKVPLRLRAVAKSLPGNPIWSQGGGFWHVSWSPAAAGHVLAAFDGEVIDGTPDWYNLRLEYAAREKAQADDGAWASLPPLPTKTEAWPHQRRVFAFAKDLRSSGLFVSMGGGKSAIAVALCEHDEADKTLIVCPKSVLGVWPKQFNAHGIREYKFWNAAEMRGGAIAKAHTMARFLLVTRQPKVVIVNYDMFWREGIAQLLCDTDWDVIMYDESHKIKAPGGKGSKFAAKMRRENPDARVLLLTGTPQPHSPADVYGQYRASDPGIFGTNFDRFRRTYFETRKINDKVEKIVGFRDDRAREDFQRKMGSIAIVVTKDDMAGSVAGEKWGLPPVERQVLLTNPTYKHYKNIRNELLTEVREGLVTADNVLVKGLRLRQATSGFLRTEDGIDSVIGNEKAELLAEVLDDIPVSGGPVVVFGVFHHDLDVIEATALRCNRTYAELSGRRRDGLAPDSTLAEGFDVVGCQLQSGGVGVDFTRSCYAVYYSVDYNLGNVEQSFARFDRPGQTRPVTFIHLVALSPAGGETVDGVTYNALAERKSLNEAVINALRKGAAAI